MIQSNTGFEFSKLKPVINMETEEVSFITVGSPDEFDVFKYFNPTIRDRQKNGLTNNLASINFYRKLDILSGLYPPHKFSCVKGNIHGKGNKFGHIICTSDISPNVKEYLENIKLTKKGQPVEYYKLERYTLMDDVPDKILIEIIRMISRKHIMEE